MVRVQERMDSPQEISTVHLTLSYGVDPPTLTASDSPELFMFSEQPELTETAQKTLESHHYRSPPSTPIMKSFKPTLFPSVDSRSPTKRFLLSRLMQKSTMSVSERFRIKFQRDDDEEKRPVHLDSSGDEEEDDSDEREDPENSDLSTRSPTLSKTTTLTDSAIKRQKKRQKKKARQTNKENMQKKQKLQLAEAQRVHEEKVATHKKMLAMYAAAVAKPTVAKKNRDVEPRAETHTSTVSVLLETTSPQYVLSSASTTSIRSTSSADVSVMAAQVNSSNTRATGDAHRPVKSVPPTSEPQTSVQMSPVPNSDEADLSLEEIGDSQCAAQTDQNREMAVSDEEVEEEEKEKIRDNEKNDGEESDEFEVLVLGQRRVVKPFLPRRHRNSASISGDDMDSLDSFAANFDVPDLYPPLPHQAHIGQNILNGQGSSQRPNQPTHCFFQVPTPRVIIGPPVNANFGSPPRPYAPFHHGFAPPQFGSIPVMTAMHPMLASHQMIPQHGQMFVPPIFPVYGPPPMGMQSMQPPRPQPPIHLHPRPHMMMPPQMPQPPQIQVPSNPPLPPQPQKQRPDFTKPPPHLPPVQMPSRPIPAQMSQSSACSQQVAVQSSSSTHSQLYPGQRPLSRPVRKPLDIVAPPPGIPTTEKKQEEVEEKESVKATEEKKVEKSKDAAPVTVVESPIRPAQCSTPGLNGELIAAGVSVILDGSDDEQPAPSVPQSTSPPQTSSEEQESLNRVLGFTKNSGGEEFAIWTGLVSEIPMRPELLTAEKYEKMLELDQMAAQNGKTLAIENADSYPNLPTVLKQMEPYFVNSQNRWMGEWADSEMLRQMFEEAHDGEIPFASWRVLKRVCSFEPGYIHVFDTLIGRELELTYIFQSSRHDLRDPLRSLWRSLTQFGREMDFFQRFSVDILPDILLYLSCQYISIRTFVAIIEVVKEGQLTESDRYYLAMLIWGHSQFYRRFNSNFSQIKISHAGDKRWVRKTPSASDPVHESSYVGPRHVHEHQPMDVSDFLAQLRPHIEDALQLIPDTVIEGDEFFKAAKLVCNWRGDHAEVIWKSIVRNSEMYQEFYKEFHHFLRMEVRMDKLYLAKLPYTGEGIAEELVTNLIVPPSTIALSSATHPEEKKSVKKKVSFAKEPTSLADMCTQTENCDMDKVWDIERELIRQLTRDNRNFADFITSDDAREMYQFLADIFKSVDLNYFSYILEKAVIEMREQSWTETVGLRTAAAEARRELELARLEHKTEFDAFQQKMETISRFETYEVQVELRSRIDSLKERIKEMTEQKEVAVKEEVREEKLAMQREKMELMRQHQHEKRILEEQIARLKQENRNALTDEDLAREFANIEQDRAILLARHEHEMNVCRRNFEETAQQHRDSQRDIEQLRRENQRLTEQLHRPQQQHQPIIHSFPTPEPEPMPDFVPSSADELSPRAQLQLAAMVKYQAEISNQKLRLVAQKMLDVYCSLEGVNRKERKCAEKQLKEFEDKMDQIEDAIVENIDLLRLNVVDDIVPIPSVPLPFTEKVIQKMNEASLKMAPTCQQDTRFAQGPGEEADVCLICYDIVTFDSESVTCETCYKEYHHPCIAQWLTINSVCPACFRGLKDPAEFPSLNP